MLAIPLPVLSCFHCHTELLSLPQLHSLLALTPITPYQKAKRKPRTIVPDPGGVAPSGLEPETFRSNSPPPSGTQFRLGAKGVEISVGLEYGMPMLDH